MAAGVSSYTDSTASNATPYEYRVVAVDLAGNRTPSAVYGPVQAMDNSGGGDTTPPEEVTGLSAAPGNGFVYLGWTRSADTALDLVDQLLAISTDGGASYGAPTSLGKEATFTQVDGLTNGQSYHFRLQVKDSSDNVSAGAVVGPATPSETAFTTVSGTLAADTTWAAGTFYVQSNLTVAAGGR